MKNIYQKPINSFNNRFFMLIILMVLSLSGFSQNVGINTTGAAPNANAGLDVNFDNKGILIPRVALTSTSSFAPLSAHVAGMLIYNTATANDVLPGFYYNTGSAWVPSFSVGTATGAMLYWSGTAWVEIPAGTTGQFLQVSPGGTPFWASVPYATLTTNAASAITTTTATSGGNISNDGGLPVLSRGVCWGTSSNPVIAVGNSTTNGTGTGLYTSSITGLTSGTIYYVRAYATNNAVTSYGNEIIFSTIPQMATTAASLVTVNSARSGGTVTTGNAPVIERGICYGTSATPTTSNTKIIDPSPGSGLFVSDLTGLNENTLYHVRSYAINAGGTAYGTDVTFTTLSTLTTTAISSITPISAISGGTVAIGGSATISARGICWSTSTGPTIALPTKTSSGTGTGAFVSSMTGLSGGQTYYVRAYATNVTGTSYGNELSFSTSVPVAPTIASTTAITGLSASTANTGGTITSDGGSAITVKGVCWDISLNPVLGTGNFTTNGAGTGAFTSSITGLTGNTTYHVRSYATNSAGTSYGPDVQFTTWVQAAYTLGQNLNYGYVAYVAPDGSGFIVSPDIAPTSPATTFTWGCNNVHVPVGTAIGTGKNNTDLIIASCGAGTAAEIAKAYNGGGFSDWFLPSSSEFQQVATNYTLFGFSGGYTSYFTSSEYGTDYTRASTFFYTGSQAYSSGTVRNGDTYTHAIRAIRTFGAPALGTVTTTAITNIAGTTATGGGNVTNDGGAPILAAGVCWNTTSGPTIADSKTNDTTATGSFSSSLTGLTFPTTYYVRAYVTTAAGTAYGSEVSFMTITVGLATVTTDAITNLATTSVTTGGNVTNENGSAVTVRGVCWSTTSPATVGIGNFSTDGTGLGAFVSNIAGLTPATPYYVRSYATNAAGTSYGNEVSFTTVALSLPTVTTNSITNLLGTSATTGGNVTADGGSAVINRGVCWDITANPDLTTLSPSGNVLYDTGTGLGAFVSNITGLNNGQQYYLRAFAINGAGTAYGSDVVFTPVGDAIPTLTTNAITNPTSTGGTSGGNITSDGGVAVTARGVCWSNLNNPPTIADSKTVDGNGTGTFTSTITGLTAGNGYWIAAYATNSLGTAYGQPEYYIPLGLPIVSTDPLQYTAPNTTAISGVNVSTDGGDPLTALGIVWGTSPAPTVDSHTGGGITTESLTGWWSQCILTGLVQSTTYYVRAYATNGQGTSYGPEIPFTPGVLGLPTTTTGIVANKIGSIAEIGTNILSDGGDPVITSGICWSTTADPTIDTNPNITIENIVSGLNYSKAFNLTVGTVYHVRAYATNGQGTAYGADITFTATAAYVGQVIQGGWMYGNVFSADGTGSHGLIADPWGYGISDWGCTSTLTGASGTILGTGQANTTAINADITTNTCVSLSGMSAFASQIVLFNGVDWYLPSKDEVTLLWTNRVSAGLDATLTPAVPIWSSSEVNATDAWYFDGTTWFNTGVKTAQYNVWPIRSF
jgi:hypothetical protein